MVLLEASVKLLVSIIIEGGSGGGVVGIILMKRMVRVAAATCEHVILEE